MENFADLNENSRDKLSNRSKYEGNGPTNLPKKSSRDLTPSRDGVAPGESGEGTLTKQIEKVTAKIPSATFLSLALGSVALSALLRLSGRRDDAQFVGQWVPTILTLGLYNKLVKLEGSE